MREVVFLKQNEKKWRQIEAFLQGKRPEPNLLADYFIQMTDDLAFARTYFPQSNVTTYLNQLTAQLHQAIYRNKKESKSRILTFWESEYPRVVWRSRKEILLSLLIVSVSVFIGAVSALHEDSFIRLILGDSYVNMTLENIQNDDPMAVYKKMNEVQMFLGITINNIRVAFMAFAAGVVLSFGAGFILFQNGVMLGAFHAFFYEQGLLGSALKTIWIHGTLEIWAIIVAGGAGLVIGNSLLFPGTYSRKESFLRGARRGVKLVFGLVPFFIVAGFLEGFVTRYTDMPLFLNLSVIVGSFILIFIYFILLPLRHYKEGYHA
jgi:uncharacterized membrane protein SpoIIM required for sporulation